MRSICPKPFFLWGLALFIIAWLSGCGNRSFSGLQNQVYYLDQTDLFSSPIRQNTRWAAPKTTIATVEGKPIFRSEFERECRLRAMHLRKRIPPEKFDELAPKIQDMALQDLIIRALLKKEIEKENVEVNSEEVENGLSEIRSSLPKDMVWETFLTTSQLTEENLRDNVRARLQVEKLLFARVRDIPEPSEGDIQSFYNKNREQFQLPELAEIRHLLLRVDPNAPNEEFELTRATAKSLRESMEDELPFEQLIQRYSEDEASKDKEGYLGKLSRKQLPTELAETAFSSEIGEVSQPIRSTQGIHLLRVDGREPARIVAFNEVHDRIKLRLNEQTRQAAVRAYVQELIDASDVVILGANQRQSPDQVSGRANRENQ